MSTTLAKTATRAVNRRIRELRAERKAWLAGRYNHWGMPWCTGPASPCHQEIACDGCAVVAWCRDRAEEIGEQIRQFEASLTPAIQGGLW